MNCLSSEDLKEERNCSLAYKPTLNLDACPVYRGQLLKYRLCLVRLTCSSELETNGRRDKPPPISLTCYWL